MRATIFAAMLVAAAISSMPARAAIFEVTYTGRVAPQDDYQFDANGIFGPSTNLMLGSFTAVFRFDTSLGQRSTNGTEDELFGGGFYPMSSPLLSATLSINSGPAVPFDGAYYAVVSSNFLVTDGYGVEIRGITGNVITSELALSIASTPSPFGNIDVPFSYTVQPGDSYGSGFELVDQFGNLRAHADLFPTSITVTGSAVTQTPLPATLPLFVSGLAGLGFLARRKRNQAA